MLILPPVHPTITIRARWDERIPLHLPSQSGRGALSPPPCTDHYTSSIPPSAPIAVGRPVIIASTQTTPHNAPLRPTKEDPTPYEHKPFKGKVTWIRRIDETRVVVGAKSWRPKAEVFMAYVTILYPQWRNEVGHRNTYPPPCPLPLITTNEAPDQATRKGPENRHTRGPSLRVRKIPATPTVGGELRRWKINLDGPRLQPRSAKNRVGERVGNEKDK